MKITTTIPVLMGLLSPAALAQRGAFTFGVDYRGPIIAMQVSGGVFQINEADVLTFGPNAPGPGPLQAPSYSIDGGLLGLIQYPLCLGHQPGVACGIEVDAVTQGMDTLLLDSSTFAGQGGMTGDKVWFSVDEMALGRSSLGVNPSVTSEGTGSGVNDAPADVFLVYGLALGPIGPGGAAASHVGVFDGDGFASAAPSGAVYAGIGMTEPFTPGTMPANGDNLDSLNVNAVLGFPLGTAYYFSLDSTFTDPATGIPNTGSAALQGVLPGDILRVPGPGITPAVYAPATSLGLDLAGGPGSDDLDALSIAENGTTGFQASLVPYDWTTGGSDMVLFSVRRGSAVIGRPDSIFGAPIEPGDILTTPLPTAMGGVSPFPGILFSAESLGLATRRSDGLAHGDEMDALDIEKSPCFDCNNNGIEDAVDISTGTSSDTNDNGVPDECEKIEEYCFCTPALSPCGNWSFDRGCANSVTGGAHLYSPGPGLTSVSADDLELVTDGVPPNKFGLYYMGGGATVVLTGDGLRCVSGGGVGTFRYGVGNSGAGGVLGLGPGIVADSCSLFPQNGCIQPGDTWYLQCWYRDPLGPCGGGFNFSNGVAVEFVP